MRCVKNRVIDRRGTTLVELTVAVAIVATVFAAVMPLFAGIRNSAEARWANLEMVQNARVLNEQLCRHLATARRITAVSAETSDDGYVQFEATDGLSYRCALGEDGWVRFGPADEPSELVGPLDSLRFACFDGNDLVNPVAAPDAARLVTWEARLRSEGSLTNGKTLRGACCLRAVVRETETVAYDFATCTPGVNGFAFADQGDPQVPDLSTSPVLPLESDQYAAMGADDEKSHVFSVSEDSRFAQVRLVFEIDQEPGNVAAITAVWRGRSVNSYAAAMDGAALYLWNYGVSAYERVHISPDTEAEIVLTGSGASPAAKYLGGAGGKTVVLLIVSNDRKWGVGGCTLSTDYAKIDVAISGGVSAFAP